jgi:hypothetical protein
MAYDCDGMQLKKISNRRECPRHQDKEIRFFFSSDFFWRDEDTQKKRLSLHFFGLSEMKIYQIKKLVAKIFNLHLIFDLVNTLRVI